MQRLRKKKAFGAAMGPAPAAVLDQESAAKRALETRRDWQGNERKQRALHRYMVYTEEFAPLVWERIGKLHSDTETIKQLQKFVDVTNNPALDITRDLCVVWKHGVKRTMKRKRQMEGVTQLAHESWLDVHLQRWNQLAFLCGPVTVVPVVRDSRLTWDVLLPHFYDVVPNPSDPFGPPLAASWTLPTDKTGPNVADTVVLDAEAWHYYSTHNGRSELLYSVRHGLGVFPGATLRFDIGYGGDDWWGGSHNQRLIDGTVMVGVINTALGFTRKAQNKKLLVALGDLGQAGEQQRHDPEIPLVVNAESPALASIQALDFDTSPDGFIQHAMWIYQSLGEAYGAQTVYMGAGSTSSNVVAGRYDFSHEALTEIRNDQIPFARAFEEDLVAKMCGMARTFLHPALQKIPTMEDVRDTFSVEYPKLARSYADPSSAAEHTDWLLKKGCISQLDILRKDYPDKTDDELFDILSENLEVQAKFNDEVTKRNLGMNGDQDIQTASQAFGALGPKAKQEDPEVGTEEQED